MKLTPEYIKAQILDVEYDHAGTFTTCTIVTVSGFRFVGTNGCLDPRQHDSELGEKLAYKAAEDQLWECEAYLFSKLGVAGSDLPCPPSLTLRGEFMWNDEDDAKIIGAEIDAAELERQALAATPEA